MDIGRKSLKHPVDIEREQRGGDIGFEGQACENQARPQDQIGRQRQRNGAIGRFQRDHRRQTEAAEHDAPRLRPRAIRARCPQPDEWQAEQQRKEIPLDEGAARQNQHGDGGDAKPAVLLRRNQPRPRQRIGEIGDRAAGDEQAIGGHDRLGAQMQQARQRDRRHVDQDRGGRIGLDHVDIGCAPVEPALADGDQPGNVAEGAEYDLLQDRDGQDRSNDEGETPQRRRRIDRRQQTGGDARAHGAAPARAARSSRTQSSPVASGGALCAARR